MTTHTDETAGDHEFEWLSAREAADQLGMATAHLLQLINDGEVPAYRFGRDIRLKSPDVDARLAEQSSQDAASS